MKKEQSEKDLFLEQYIFHGLTNMNDGFDSPTIKYFTESDFRIILERVQQFNIGVYGIEPWKDGHMFDVYDFNKYSKKSTDPEWYFAAFDEFLSTGEQLLYSATYSFPELEED